MTRDAKPPDGYEDDGKFQTVMFGYDRAQVDEYIDAICDELHVLSGAVKRLTPLEHDLVAANSEVQRLREIAASGNSRAVAGVRIQQMLQLAEDEAGSVRQDAQRVIEQANRDAAEIRKAAEEDAQHVAADRRQEYERLREEVLAGAHAEADRILADANGRAGGMALAANVKNGMANRPSGGTESHSPAKGGSAKGGPGGSKNGAKKRGAKPGES